jgi:hypothetical protein
VSDPQPPRTKDIAATGVYRSGRGKVHLENRDELARVVKGGLPFLGRAPSLIGAAYLPPTPLGLSPDLIADASSSHFIALLRGSAEDAARPVVHSGPYQQRLWSVLYLRHPASVLMSNADCEISLAVLFETDRSAPSF